MLNDMEEDRKHPIWFEVTNRLTSTRGKEIHRSFSPGGERLIVARSLDSVPDTWRNPPWSSEVNQVLIYFLVVSVAQVSNRRRPKQFVWCNAANGHQGETECDGGAVVVR
ncbi:Hypothetical protein SMAX5B_009251 [Scophthalmus maximus]|uniref:Uncharacterized protein n=1 Tax=Scophthalmus maximus TaxID=52904 RepID=A0A2U9C450_SCOMX|nr:Hypothetical protein SMAX5B_009251 [Scophthalmus maximus]KAF0041644.1 hypothetical protein F2P81_005176 [Scophthalmus maximus]